MDRYNWAAIPREEMSEKVVRQVVHTDRMTIARVLLRAGAVVGMHDHQNEQVTMLESGAMKFIFGGAEAGRVEVLRAGDVLRIPSGVPHSVESLEDSLATDLFAPRRDDWIRGEDAYLRGEAASLKESK